MDYMSNVFVAAELGIEPGMWWILGKHSITEPHLQLDANNFKEIYKRAVWWA
jgi:hypothetical protein